MTCDGKDQAMQWFSTVDTVDRFDCAFGLTGLENREKTVLRIMKPRKGSDAGDGADLPW